VPLAAFAIGVWLLVRFLLQGGTNVRITFPDAEGIKPKDTPVVYRGMNVGQVTAVSLGDDHRSVDATVNIDDSVSDLLRAGTLFWLRGAKPSFTDLSSLGAVLSGPTIAMEPGPGEPAREFHGLSREPAVPRDHGPAARFAVSFDGAVGGLSAGDAVKIGGVPVGEVEQAGLRYDAATGRLETPVTLALYPRLFHLDPGDAFRSAVGRLVGEGLRATVEKEPPLLGTSRVALQMTSAAPPAEIRVVDGLPVIPTAPADGIETIVDRVQGVPIDEIGQHVLDIAKHVDEIASSHELSDSVGQLDASLREIRRTVKAVTPKVDRIVQSLDDAAGQLHSTARAADRTLGGSTTQTGVADTLREMKEAARSIRSLADYLDRHPEALISGRSRD
jgi:paraquat-inducible protein B